MYWKFEENPYEPIKDCFRYSEGDFPMTFLKTLLKYRGSRYPTAKPVSDTFNDVSLEQARRFVDADAGVVLINGKTGFSGTRCRDIYKLNRIYSAISSELSG